VRATIFQASGRYDEALAIRQYLTQTRPDIRSLGAEASVRAERGEIDEAERLFVKAQQQYRDVSPFPVVWLYFQQGLMWMWEGNLERARVAFEAACARLPGYAAAQGHLAMVEAALARRERAMAVFHRWMQAGDLEQARNEALRLHEFTATAPDRPFLALSHNVMAKVAIAAGKPQEARDHLSQAVSIVRNAKLPLAAWRVYTTAANFYERVGDTKKAAKCRCRSDQIVRSLANSLEIGAPLRSVPFFARTGVGGHINL